MTYPTTPNLGLSLIPDGDQAWGQAMRDNMTRLDETVLTPGERQASATTPALGYYETALIEVDLSLACDLTVLETDHPAWVRFYGSAAARAEDATRLISQKVTDGRGVYGDAITYLPDGLILNWSEVPTFHNLDTPRTGKAYLAVTNLDTSYSGPISLLITYLPIEDLRPGAMQGLPGLDGRTILPLDRDPIASDGKDGDLAINHITWTVFFPKAGGAWPVGVPLVGPPGPDGQGVPRGGTTDQALYKKSNADFDIEWRTPSEGGGSTYTFWDPDKAPATPSSLDDEFDGTALDVKWTTVNWASASLKDVNSTSPGRLHIESSGTSNTMMAALQPLPTGDFIAFTRVAGLGVAASPNVQTGLVITNDLTPGSGNQLIWCAQNYSNYQEFVTLFTWTNFSTSGTSLSGGMYAKDVKYLSIKRVGSSYSWGWSPDGITWNWVAINPSFTPTYIGLAHVANVGSKSVSAFEFFRCFSDPSSKLGGLRSVLTA